MPAPLTPDAGNPRGIAVSGDGACVAVAYATGLQLYENTDAGLAPKTWVDTVASPARMAFDGQSRYFFVQLRGANVYPATFGLTSCAALVTTGPLSDPELVSAGSSLAVATSGTGTLLLGGTAETTADGGVIQPAIFAGALVPTGYGGRVLLPDCTAAPTLLAACQDGSVVAAVCSTTAGAGHLFVTALDQFVKDGVVSTSGSVLTVGAVAGITSVAVDPGCAGIYVVTGQDGNQSFSALAKDDAGGWGLDVAFALASDGTEEPIVTASTLGVTLSPGSDLDTVYQLATSSGRVVSTSAARVFGSPVNGLSASTSGATLGISTTTSAGTLRAP